MSLLEDPLSDLVRDDAELVVLDFDRADYATPERVVDLLLEYPKLMQRPLLVTENRAIIGRPTSRVSEFLAG